MARSEQLQIRVSAAQKAAIRRQARRSGVSMSEWVLSRALPSARTDFDARVARLAREKGVASHALAAIHDFLARLSAEALREATEAPPSVRPSAFHEAYLAAMIEQASHRAGVAVPDWVRRVGPVPQPYFASTLGSVRLHLLHASPPPFRRRNLFVDATLGDRV